VIVKGKRDAQDEKDELFQILNAPQRINHRLLKISGGADGFVR
jgi:hypothetical protein